VFFLPRRGIFQRVAAQTTLSKERDRYRDYILSLPVRIDRGVTLTLKQHRVSYDARGYRRVETLKISDVEQLAEAFMKRLNKRILGRSYSNFENSLFFLPVFERGSVSGRLHLHFAVGNIPNHISPKKFGACVVKAFCGLDWADKQFDIDFSPFKQSIINYLTDTIRDDSSEMLLWERTPDKMLSHAV
jgi:hypothetical protein